MHSSPILTHGNLFLKKLFDMVSSTPPALGGWCKGGTAFEIKNAAAFERLMLPKYFKQCKFTSFVRQLNFYGFEKLKRPVLLPVHETQEAKKTQTFSHMYFQQEKPHLLVKMKRKTSPSSSSDGATSDGGSITGSNAVDHIRCEVEDIKSSLILMGQQLAQLTHLVSKRMHDDDDDAAVPLDDKTQSPFIPAAVINDADSHHLASQVLDLDMLEFLLPLVGEPSTPATSVASEGHQWVL
ncbi:Aste57867_9490 [Aphanomyces stellatus]|uniref:Aste57867_9490 protein n=1 Tax=Aphanomyces stellatus TaxID=120398 RepID=A0A485KMX3_9STRA|nr:hypothetical protein As57867_009453 [Aphanomyces stellatus]VFT86369.1 Aste57867_9490 [Aphanomyces stellatus]